MSRKLLTWRWSHFAYQLRLTILYKGRHAITLTLVTSIGLPDSWFVSAPKIFGAYGRVGFGLTVKEAGVLVRQVVAEMMAEEFAGVS